ncbi:hypothetical protein [Cryobacterium sp. Y29]|nr:hypothetical protein [Cryobacterium sp. Y29]
MVPRFWNADRSWGMEETDNATGFAAALGHNATGFAAALGHNAGT